MSFGIMVKYVAMHKRFSKENEPTSYVLGNLSAVETNIDGIFISGTNQEECNMHDQRLIAVLERCYSESK